MPRELCACFVVALAICACSRGSDADASKLAGTWRDATGDAPWQWIELTARDDGHGTFAGRRTCDRPPCDPIEQGDYDLDGKTLRVHSRSLEGQGYVVQIGGDVMEWRQNDVMIRRFKRERPTPEPEPREDYPSRSAARPAGTPCEALTAQGCLWSKECVLEAPDRQLGSLYVCRPARPPCEGGIAEADPGFAADCHGRAGCRVRKAECFCPNAATKMAPAAGSAEERLARVLCACGGGETQGCVRGK